MKLAGDRLWWTVMAVTEHYAALTSPAAFHPAGTRCYTVVDWRNGVRGPCNLLGQTWGSGAYTEAECADMLAEFEAGTLQVSQRNFVPIWFADDDPAKRILTLVIDSRSGTGPWSLYEVRLDRLDPRTCADTVRDMCIEMATTGHLAYNGQLRLRAYTDLPVNAAYTTARDTATPCAEYTFDALAEMRTA